MKTLISSIAMASLVILNTANAEVLSANLSQDNKQISVQLQEQGVLSIQYDIQKRPVLRSSEWWYYAVKCTTSDKSTLEYPLNGQLYTTGLPALLSNDDDQQKVGLNMDETGVIKISNHSHGKIYVTCELHNKFGA